ncbi:MAG TPA: MerR family transcriptional regulator [Actinoplanes sp.]|nr:MerR family transcriptional regulator [Actinoplanes sp.]
MLTISELADLAGVTPRAVRHYHRIGVLPEPPRRGNGYRTYGAADLIRLTRIRRMQDVGLSLAEIGRLVQEPAADDTRAALQTLDADLARQQDELARRRAAIAAVLAGPGDLALPAELAVLLDRAASLGLPAEAIAVERDALALLVALYPDRLPRLVALYTEALGDARMVELGVRFSALADAAVDDPAVDALAAELADALRGRAGHGPAEDWRVDVMATYFQQALSAAQRRCAELIGKGLQ